MSLFVAVTEGRRKYREVAYRRGVLAMQRTPRYDNTEGIRSVPREMAQQPCHPECNEACPEPSRRGSLRETCPEPVEEFFAEFILSVAERSRRAQNDTARSPWHLLGMSLALPIITDGLTQTMMWGDGYGVSRPDLYVTSLMDRHREWRHRANELSETVKLFTLFGTYIRESYGSRYYGKAINLARQLMAAYDSVLATYDLLLMPTTPMKAQPLPQPEASREEIVERAFEMLTNTAPFDISHHPAMAIPCGMRDGLPVSMMLVGKHCDEPTIYRAAYAFEQASDWKQM